MDGLLALDPAAVETEKALKLFFRERREGRRQESSPFVIRSPLYLFMLAGCAGI